MKKELKWFAASGIISAIIVGLMTDFTFRKIEIQLHDNLVVLDAFSAILYLSYGLWAVSNVRRIAKVTRGPNFVGTILISIINPLVGLFTAILLYYNVDRLLVFKKANPGITFSGQLYPICILAAILALQIIVEVKALKRVSLIFDQQRSGHEA